MPVIASKSRYQSAEFTARLQRRYAAERRFRMAGIAAVGLASLMLVVLLGSIVSKGYTAFWQTQIRLEVTLDKAQVDERNYMGILRQALYAQVPEVTDRAGRRSLNELLSSGAPYELEALVKDNPSIVGTKQTVWVLADDEVDQFRKGFIRRDVPESERRLNDIKIGAIDKLAASGAIAGTFNTPCSAPATAESPSRPASGAPSSVPP